MHTRRLASFILGAWMLGSLLMVFVIYQNGVNVDKVMNNPPGPVAKDIEDLGSDITRMLLRFQATEMNRFLYETWGVGQIGIGLALLSAVTFTSHRSKFLMFGSAAMILLVVIQVFYTTSSMAALGRTFDFMPANAALKERDLYQGYSTMNTLAEILKLLLGAGLAVRLLIDRYGWKKKLLPNPPKRLERRRKSVTSSGGSSGRSHSSDSGSSRSHTGDRGEVAVESDVVDKPDDGHVDG